MRVWTNFPRTGCCEMKAATYLNELFRELEASGLLAQNRVVGFGGNEFQMVTLSQLGDDVMRGKAFPVNSLGPSAMTTNRSKSGRDGEAAPQKTSSAQPRG